MAVIVQCGFGCRPRETPFVAMSWFTPALFRRLPQRNGGYNVRHRCPTKLLSGATIARWQRLKQKKTGARWSPHGGSRAQEGGWAARGTDSTRRMSTPARRRSSTANEKNVVNFGSAKSSRDRRVECEGKLLKGGIHLTDAGGLSYFCHETQTRPILSTPRIRVGFDPRNPDARGNRLLVSSDLTRRQIP
jgi:hypothetical protein